MHVSCATYSFVADSISRPTQSDPLTEDQVLALVDSVSDRLAGGLIDGLELWFRHTPAGTLTPFLASEIRRRLRSKGMVSPVCGGSVGNPSVDPDASEAWFQVASMLHAGIIAGDVLPGSLDELTKLSAAFGIGVAYENHPEGDVEEILDRIEGGNQWIGVALDTGSLAEHGGDPVKAVSQLGDRIIHVHLRDVPELGSELSVPIGSGIVDAGGVLRALSEAAYSGWVSIEIPLAAGDPSEAILNAAGLVRAVSGS